MIRMNIQPYHELVHLDDRPEIKTSKSDASNDRTRKRVFCFVLVDACLTHGCMKKTVFPFRGKHM